MTAIPCGMRHVIRSQAAGLFFAGSSRRGTGCSKKRTKALVALTNSLFGLDFLQPSPWDCALLKLRLRISRALSSLSKSVLRVA